jgi:hypothetical protein
MYVIERNTMENKMKNKEQIELLEKMIGYSVQDQALSIESAKKFVEVGLKNLNNPSGFYRPITTLEQLVRELSSVVANLKTGIIQEEKYRFALERLFEAE